MFLVNSVSVSDTAGMAAKQETGAKEKATDCGFVSTIKSGGAYSINWWTTITIRKFCRRHKQSIHRYVIFRFPVESKRKLVLSVRQCLAGFLFRGKIRRRRLKMGWPGQSFFHSKPIVFTLTTIRIRTTRGFSSGNSLREGDLISQEKVISFLNSNLHNVTVFTKNNNQAEHVHVHDNH